ILVGVDDEPQAKVDDVTEGVVVQAGAMPGSHRLDGLVAQQLRNRSRRDEGGQQRFIKSPQLAHRASSIAAGTDQRCELRGRRRMIRNWWAFFRRVGSDDALAVLRKLVRWNAQPR